MGCASLLLKRSLRLVLEKCKWSNPLWICMGCIGDSIYGIEVVQHEMAAKHDSNFHLAPPQSQRGFSCIRAKVYVNIFTGVIVSFFVIFQARLVWKGLALIWMAMGISNDTATLWRFASLTIGPMFNSPCTLPLWFYASILFVEAVLAIVTDLLFIVFIEIQAFASIGQLCLQLPGSNEGNAVEAWARTMMKVL